MSFPLMLTACAALHVPCSWYLGTTAVLLIVFYEYYEYSRGEWLEWMIIVLIAAEIALSVYDITS